MASVYDVHVVKASIGAFTGATEWPIIYFPPNMGKVTILSVKASCLLYTSPSPRD